MQGLPSGYRFSPTDEELVNFLRNKLRGEQLPHDVMFECDIYDDKEPWMIFDKTLKQYYYVFTKLKKKSKSRMERRVGCGTWKEDGTKPIFNHEKRCIGFKKTFHFHAKPSSSSRTKETNGHWIMHEFSIGKSDDYVLCKIRNKDLDKSEGVYDPQLRAALDRIFANHDASQGNKSQRLGSKENQLEKNINLSNNVAPQQPMDTSEVLAYSSMEQPQETLYMHTKSVPMDDIATTQGNYAQSFGTTYFSMEEGNQPQHMIQFGGNGVATEQFNETPILDFPMESSSRDSIFDGLPDITPTKTNIEDIDTRYFLDYSIPELNSDNQNAFHAMIASFTDQQPPLL